MATKKKSAKKFTVRLSVNRRALKQVTTRTVMALAFDEWLRRYTKNPAKFQAEFKIVQEFRAGQQANGATRYGNNCAALLLDLMAQVTVKRVHRVIRARRSKK